MKKRVWILLASLLLLGALLLTDPACRYVCRIGDFANVVEEVDAELPAISDRALDKLLSRAAKRAMPSGKAPLIYEILSQSPVIEDGRTAWLIFLRVRDADSFVTVVGTLIRPRWQIPA